MMIMVLLTHRRSNCLVIRGQIFFREKKESWKERELERMTMT